MKKYIFLVSILIIGFAVSTLINNQLVSTENFSEQTPLNKPSVEIPDVEVVAKNLEIPWDIAFLSDGRLLVTERPGRLSRIEKNGELTLIHNEVVKDRGEGGLLGIALHPKFNENGYIYLYFSATGENKDTVNRVERFRLADTKLTDRKTIISGIPGAIYHDGGRMEFGPDGLLYITTGDATTPKIAKDLSSLGGKVLRVNDDGSIPKDNPFGTRVFSYGHRNSQGLAWDSLGQLWSTEHGRSGVSTGLDEVNLIERGGNYGWPDSQGDSVAKNTIAPALHSGPNETWAPASVAFLKNSIFFGGLRGEALYEAKLDGKKVIGLKKYFHKEFGRIRTVRVGPDGLLYITTSNRDDRGTAKEGDDKIIRINPKSL